MHSQMHSQTLQALRSEIEAVTTLQMAFNRIGLSVEPDALALWAGPRPEDVGDVAADDGSFPREVVSQLRAQAGAALAGRYLEVEKLVLGRAALENVLRSTLAMGTGGAATPEGPPAADVLSALVRSGSLRQDWVRAAAAQAARVLAEAAQAPKRALRKKKSPKKAAPAKKKIATKTRARVAKRKSKTGSAKAKPPVKPKKK
jgi:hypothetical protein